MRSKISAIIVGSLSKRLAIHLYTRFWTSTFCHAGAVSGSTLIVDSTTKLYRYPDKYLSQALRYIPNNLKSIKKSLKKITIKK